MTNKTQKILLYVLLCTVALILYGRTVTYPLIWDSKVTVLGDASLQSLSNVGSFFTDKSTPAQQGLDGSQMRGLSFYRPLARTAMALQYAVFGNNHGGYHAVSLLLHAGVLMMIYLLFVRLHGSRLLACTAAILFSVNPVHVEAVSWVHSVTSLWMTLLCVCALLAYISGRWVLSGLAFVSALLFRETSILLVPVFVVYELAFPRGAKSDAGIRLLSFTAVGVVYYMLRSAVAGGVPASGLGWLEHINTFMVANLKLLMAFFYPAGDVVHYLNASFPAFTPEVILAWLVTVLWAVGTLLLYRVNRLAFFWSCWIGIWLVINITVGASGSYLVAEKQMYPVGIGICALAAMMLAKKRAGLIGVGIIVLFQAVIVWGRVGYYSDEVKFLSAAIEYDANHHLARYSLANEYAGRGDFENAASEYEALIESWPHHSGVINNLGNCNLRLGNDEQARACFEKAFKLDPSNLKAAGMVAQLSEKAGDLKRALELYHLYHQGNPGDAWSAQKIRHLHHQLELEKKK